MDADTSVNFHHGVDEVNRSTPGLSKQQRAVIAAIARLKREEDGRYWPKHVSYDLGYDGDRSASASLSRALARLEARGILRRHPIHRDAKKHDGYFFTLTEAGLRLVNEERRRQGLEPLGMVLYVPKPGLTAEEFDARMKALTDGWAMTDAKAAAGKLSPEALAEFRQWLDARLAQKQAGQGTG
jgi:hypothetical protein